MQTITIKLGEILKSIDVNPDTKESISSGLACSGWSVDKDSRKTVPTVSTTCTNTFCPDTKTSVIFIFNTIHKRYETVKIVSVLYTEIFKFKQIPKESPHKTSGREEDIEDNKPSEKIVYIAKFIKQTKATYP